MNFLRQIKELLDEYDCTDNNVKISVWTDELAVYIQDKEIGISVFPSKNRVVFDTEGYDYQLGANELMVLSQVMSILCARMDEIKELTK